MKNKIHISSNLVADLQQYTKNVAKGMSMYVRDELTKTTRDAIEKFYSSWTPHTYNRHYYNFLENSFRPYYKNPHNTIIRGGVELTPYLMDDIYYSIAKNSKSKYESTPGIDSNEPKLTDYIFNLVYMGYHGNISMLNSNLSVARMSPSPYDLIMDKRDYLLNNIQSIKKYGINYANGEAYKTPYF